MARGEKATQLVDLSDNEPGDVKTEPKLEIGAGMNLYFLCFHSRDFAIPDS